MSNLTVNVDFQKLLKTLEAGKASQSQAIITPSKYHAEIIEEISRLIVGTYRANHPDILIIGTVEKPPAVDNCRWLIDNIAMKPLEGKKRLAIIESADKLNKSAGNSLLKLTEEPPPHAYIIYLMEDGRLFLPTLRSRTSLTTITFDAEISPQRYPLDAQEWIDWLTKSRKSENDEITSDITSWYEYALKEGGLETAITLEKLRQISERKNLSIPMLCDLIILILMYGEKENDNILDDIRKA